MAPITSRHHPIVARFREAARGSGSALLLDGWHLLHDALEAGLTADTIAITADPADPLAHDVLARVAPPTEVIPVSSSVMNAISPVRTPTGVVALCRRPEVDFAALLQPAPPLVVVALDLQDPGNVGAVTRAAEAGGATGVVFGEGSADPWGWKALRGAMGSTFRLPVMRTRAVAATIDELKASSVTLIGTSPRGGTPMEDVDLCGPLAVILGGEGAGVPDALLRRVDRHMSIPMRPPVESLNVAVAAALIVYEARRQRAAKRGQAPFRRHR